MTATTLFSAQSDAYTNLNTRQMTDIKKMSRNELDALFLEVTDDLMDQGFSLLEIAKKTVKQLPKLNYKRIRNIRSQPNVKPVRDEVELIFDLFADHLVYFNEAKPEINELEQRLKQIEQLSLADRIKEVEKWNSEERRKLINMLAQKEKENQRLRDRLDKFTDKGE